MPYGRGLFIKKKPSALGGGEGCCHEGVPFTGPDLEAFVKRPTGRSSDSRIILLAAPSRPIGQWVVLRRLSPITAAGPRRIHTVFPFQTLSGRL